MTSKNSAQDRYYIPESSHWPIVGSLGLFSFLLGFTLLINDMMVGAYITGAGLLTLLYLFYGWFKEVVNESMKGYYSAQVSTTFRQAMIWFIASEVFFFAAFFACLYYVRMISLPSLGGEGHLASSQMLWESFTFAWPLINMPDATNYTIPKEAMGPLGLPLINTVILLTSGLTLTWAHWGLKVDKRSHFIAGLAVTVALGFIFVGLQAYEYMHAYHELHLTLNSGIYGSMFYLLTGFHGFHVTMGAIMLAVILFRAMKGHFTHDNHFAFEAAAWYWHFVDVVWLGLYIFVYWL